MDGRTHHRRQAWWEPCNVCVGLLCCLQISVEDTQNSNSETKPELADPPKALARKRRNLSVTCLDRIPGSENSMGLFNRLPRELRDMIYEEVLGGDFVHFSWIQEHKRYIYSDNTDRSVIYTGNRRNGKVALLRTCRNIYVEAIHVLYSTNTFGFGFNRHTNTPCGFFHAISSQRLAIITSIHIACHALTIFSLWTRSEAKENWTKLWATIATEMQMLKDVTVSFGGGEDWVQYLREPGSEDWEEWINCMACARPILKIGGLRRFELEVNGTRRVLENQRGDLEAVREYLAARCHKRRAKVMDEK